MNCIVCGTPIPEKRLQILPGTKTCVNHSTASKFSMNIVQHGTVEGDGFQEFEIIRNPKVQEDLENYKKQLGTYK